MDSCPTIEEVGIALAHLADENRRRIRNFREQLRAEGKDAADPGHCGTANDLKFSIACIGQLLASLPGSESLRRVVVCADPETDENTAYAIVTSGRGGVNVAVRGWKVQTLSGDAPAHASLLDCCVGDDTALGRVIALDEGDS